MAGARRAENTIHYLVNTEGLVLKGEIHSATVPDQGGIKLLLEAARERLAPFC
jgi:hypothetical protein